MTCPEVVRFGACLAVDNASSTEWFQSNPAHTTASLRSALARALAGSGRASATARVNDSEEGGGPPAQRGAQAPHVRRQSPEPDDGERVQDDISTGDQTSHGAVSVHFGFIQLNAAGPVIVPVVATSVYDATHAGARCSRLALRFLARLGAGIAEG